LTALIAHHMLWIVIPLWTICAMWKLFF